VLCTHRSDTQSKSVGYLDISFWNVKLEGKEQQVMLAVRIVHHAVTGLELGALKIIYILQLKIQKIPPFNLKQLNDQAIFTEVIPTMNLDYDFSASTTINPKALAVFATKISPLIPTFWKTSLLPICEFY